MGRERSQDTWKTKITSASRARLVPVLLLAKVILYTFDPLRMLKFAYILISSNMRQCVSPDIIETRRKFKVTRYVYIALLPEPLEFTSSFYLTYQKCAAIHC